MTKEQAREAVEAIVEDLSDRKGLESAWSSIDPEIQEEILETWTALLLVMA